MVSSFMAEFVSCTTLIYKHTLYLEVQSAVAEWTYEWRRAFSFSQCHYLSLWSRIYWLHWGNSTNKSALYRLGMVNHAYNPSTQKVEACLKKLKPNKSMKQQPNQHYPGWASIRCWCSTGHRLPYRCALVTHWSQGRVGSGLRCFPDQNTGHSTKCATSFLWLCPKGDPLSPF
jgi:hypothetical protein